MAQIDQNDVGAFFDEVSSISDMIRKAQANISQIDELHSRTLGIISDDERIKRQLESITSETRGILTQIKDRIKKLEVSNLKQAKSGDIEVRKAQTSNLRQKFMETLQNYQNVEYQNRQKYRQRMERQYRIVKPQATQEEIDSAIDNDDAAKEALKEELANLFHEMSIIVEAQDQTIVDIEQEATQVSTNMEQGAQHVDQALTSARAARKKKWYCFGISIILLIVLIVVLYITVIKPMIDKNNNRK
ncbi:12758_t:CDS:2 [Entrophospora sp. SA101]|nr:12758_t:CDS:2 [Entrophospora sp. SA101]